MVSHAPPLAVRRKGLARREPAPGTIQVDVGGQHLVSHGAQVIDDALGTAGPGLPAFGVALSKQKQVQSATLLMIFAGLPAMITLAGNTPAHTAPKPTTELAPIREPGRMPTWAATHTLSSITTGSTRTDAAGS